MRKILWCSIITLLYLSTSLGQTPQALQYQAVARKSDGSLLANQPISVSFSILYKHAGGTALLYKETHQDTTNAFGLFNLQIGTGTPDSGSWYIVDWSLGNMFLKVEIDEGTGVLDMGTTQLISVPYALYAEKAKLAVQSLSSLTSLDLTLPYTGSTSFDGPTFQVTNTEIDFTTAGIWGQVSSPKNGSGGLYGFATAAIGETYGVYGRTNSGSAFAAGVRGHAQDPILPAVAQNTYGVHGTTNSRGDHAAGVLGEATADIGAGATYGVQGRSFSDNQEGAGVVAEGNGVTNDPFNKVPRAAALEIKNGAIRVTGPQKPSGTVKADTWELIFSAIASSPQLESHPHVIGATAEAHIDNDLITPESQIFVSVEGTPPHPGFSCFAQITDKQVGTATVLVSVMGMIEPVPIPQYVGEVLIHYLIINTEVGGVKAPSGN